MKTRDIIQIIDKELNWCIENPDEAFHTEYRKGFVNGLIQAKYLIVELKELRASERRIDAGQVRGRLPY